MACLLVSFLFLSIHHGATISQFFLSVMVCTIILQSHGWGGQFMWLFKICMVNPTFADLIFCNFVMECIGGRQNIQMMGLNSMSFIRFSCIDMFFPWINKEIRITTPEHACQQSHLDDCISIKRHLFPAPYPKIACAHACQIDSFPLRYVHCAYIHSVAILVGVDRGSAFAFSAGLSDSDRSI